MTKDSTSNKVESNEGIKMFGNDLTLKANEGGKLKIKIYRTIILPVILHGCETWSLTLREERRLRVFENRVLRRVFGPKRDDVTGN